ncbi:MAG TPA: cytochrome c, partial [Candidatus Methylomirabilis sp.]|nr:cytochrome c [Candidatus Methylomirabilis sp.]
MHAQDRPDIDPKTLIDNRVSKYRELGVSFKNVLDELKSDAPQIMVIRIASRQITAVARAQYDWFPPSSAQQPGVETRAKPDIWTEPARFKAAQDAFALAADDFAKAV